MEVQEVVDFLKKEVKEKTFLDVGKGVAEILEISPIGLNKALEVLRQQDYTLHVVSVKQHETQQRVTYKVLASPGTKWVDVKRGEENIKLIGDPNG